MAKALFAMMDTDTEARTAWEGRMQAVRQGCAAAIDALVRDGVLTPDLKKKEAVDLLWTLLSVRNWEMLVKQCGWSQKRYVTHMQKTASRILLAV